MSQKLPHCLIPAKASEKENLGASGLIFSTKKNHVSQWEIEKSKMYSFLVSNKLDLYFVKTIVIGNILVEACSLTFRCFMFVWLIWRFNVVVKGQIDI